MGSCLDLRDKMDDPKVHEAFGLILSGKKGYKPVIERRVEPKKCSQCGIILSGEEKFCPECGSKIAPQAALIAKSN